MNSARYRHDLPQMGEARLLTDGGLETTLVFHDGFDLPCFAAFDLLRTREGRDHLGAYYARYAGIAAERGLGFILDSPTWRASADWGEKLGYSRAALAAANREALDLMFELRERFEAPGRPFVASGNIGPRGDGYSPDNLMTPDEAQDYHGEQVRIFADAGADMVTVLTMTHTGEATGIARAAADAGVPCAMSFTVETDGRLPTGQSLGEAIDEVDAETGAAPAYYMINCAHPEHFRDAVAGGAAWTRRIRGLRANASRLSHAELDQAETLDDGDPEALGREHAELLRLLPNLRVFGGCCGTDHRHVACIARACTPEPAAA